MKFLAAGLVTITIISIAGAGIGTALARYLDLEKKLFTYALLGFALTEAIALFGLIVAFLILFAL